ncbi:hypothetical protein E2C01_006955 [Portunus trituberculatus]|uniref:Uncharacterized protein n=1 Tax=Portunus trituberculatus TaxID=210409 RepID=A0A5B7D131_PORTR|nr:hypothetical protein [Portunus trituberculatus]
MVREDCLDSVTGEAATLSGHAVPDDTTHHVLEDTLRKSRLNSDIAASGRSSGVLPSLNSSPPKSLLLLPFSPPPSSPPPPTTPHQSSPRPSRLITIN